MKLVCQLMEKSGRGLARALTTCLALVVLAAACSSSESVGPSGRPTGNWVGSLASGSFGINLNIVIVEDGTGKVTGNGYITTSVGGLTTGTAAVTVAGTFVAPHLAANLASQGFNTMNLSGPISGNNFNAVLNGSGFNSETMVLTRQ